MSGREGREGQREQERAKEFMPSTNKRFIEGYKGDIKAREQAIALAIQSHVLKPYNLLPNSVKLN